VTRRIEQAARAITVELILHRFSQLCARSHGALGESVHIRHVDHDADRRSTQRGGTLRAAIRKFVGQHDDRARDFDFGVPDFAARHRYAMQFGRAERLLVKLNRLRRVLAGEIGSRMFISSWNGKRCFSHVPSLGLKNWTVNRLGALCLWNSKVTSLDSTRA